MLVETGDRIKCIEFTKASSDCFFGHPSTFFPYLASLIFQSHATHKSSSHLTNTVTILAVDLPIIAYHQLANPRSLIVTVEPPLSWRTCLYRLFYLWTKFHSTCRPRNVGCVQSKLPVSIMTAFGVPGAVEASSTLGYVAAPDNALQTESGATVMVRWPFMPLSFIGTTIHMDARGTEQHLFHTCTS